MSHAKLSERSTVDGPFDDRVGNRHFSRFMRQGRQFYDVKEEIMVKSNVES
jgi:hypothetical protein